MDKVTHEYQCRYAVRSWNWRNSGEHWECAWKQAAETAIPIRGCFASECMHNRQNGLYESKYASCPLASSGPEGKCECHEDRRYCEQGEKMIRSSTRCYLWTDDPLGCRLAERLTKSEMAKLLAHYANHAIGTTNKQGKYQFSDWFRSMMKEVGIPQELRDHPIIGKRKITEYKTIDEYNASMEKCDELIASITKEAKRIAKECMGSGE